MVAILESIANTGGRPSAAHLCCTNAAMLATISLRETPSLVRKYRGASSSYMTDRSTHSLQQEASFAKAFEEFSEALFRHAHFRISNRERALDIVQDAFLKAWDYVQGGGEVQSYKSFLYRILNNLIIDEYRKRKPQSLDELLENDTGAMEAKLSHGSARETETELDEEKLLTRIRSRIQDLPETYRSVVALRYIEGFTPKEIASMMAVTENVISVRIHRGVIKLRELCESPQQEASNNE